MKKSVLKITGYFKKGLVKLKSHIYTAFYYDFSIKGVIEVLFPSIIIGLFVINRYYFTFEVKNWIIFVFLLWAGLALIGFFIPTAREYVTFGQGTKETKHNEPGIPVRLNIKSKGGFIAGRKIKISAKIVNLDKNTDSKKEFLEKFDEFSIVYFNSFKLPLDKGGYLEGSPDAGGIFINMKKLRGRATIIFNSPGAFFFRTIYKFKGEEGLNSQLFNNNELAKPLFISPHESYMSLRNYAIGYSLTLIILLLTALQLKII